MRIRIITGVVLSLFFASLIYFQGWYFRIVVMLASAFCMFELYDAFRKKGMQPIQWLCVAYPAALLGAYELGSYFGYREALLMPVMLMFSMVSLVVMVARKEADYPSLSATMFTMIYPGLMLSLVYPLMDIGDIGMATVALTLSMTIAFAGDVAAYCVGIRWGKHKLCPNISPKKTVEGALAGLCASTLWSMAIAIVAGFFIEGLPPLWHFTVLGLIAGACSQCGDLTASIVKRYCGVKDYGTIFPGHGGMMDRLDGALFNIVVVYVYFRLTMI